MRPTLLALISAALFWSTTQALAAPGDDIGAAVRVVNLVTAAYERDQRDLATGDNVRQDELIEVGSDGIGEIRLRDDTELALGPGSRLLLDEFVYDPDISGGAIVVNLVKGAFRFVTGIAAKPAYVIRTPTASVTVRGTIFDVYVQASGLSWLLLIDGAIEVCNEKGDCGLLDEPGKLIRITPDGVVGDPVKWADLETDGLPFETAFPFIVTPPEIDPDPVFTPEDIVGGDVPDAPPYDDEEEDVDDDTGPAPPYPQPPLHCWTGWKEVPAGWSKKGWRVKKKGRGRHAIFCAHPVAPPSGGGGLPPVCIGGKVIVLKTLPPRWRCICPDGKKRRRIGPHAFKCEGRPGGGAPDPKKDCLKRGGIWKGKVCIIPDPVRPCPKGYVGKWPNCKKVIIEKCPKGTFGKWPKCTKVIIEKCPKGTFGKWPNCKKPKPKPKPKKTIKDAKKVIKNLFDKNNQKKD